MAALATAAKESAMSSLEFITESKSKHIHMQIVKNCIEITDLNVHAHIPVT